MQEQTGFVFGPFRLDMRDERLWRGHEVIPLRYKTLAVLHALVAQAGQLMTKDALLAALWSETVVSETALTVAIRELRRALGDRAQRSQFIETVHGRGYRFIAPVTVLESSPERPQSVVTPRLVQSVARDQTTLFVGREGELAQLAQCYTAALQGTRQIVCMSGEAGIGKTALVDTFVSRLAAPAPVWLGRGQCIEHHGAGEAYLPLFEILRQYGEAPHGRELIALLHQRAPTWLLHLPGLVPPADLEALQRRVSGGTRERMLRELAEAIEILAGQRPVLLILEDLHWSDVSTLDWLSYVAQRRGPARLLVLATYRPGEALVHTHAVQRVTQELQGRGQCVALVLDPLPESAVAAYVAQRAGSPRVPAGLVRVLYHRTSGNPLFLTTLVNELVQRGMLRCGPSGWEMPTGLVQVAARVPETLRRLIERQLQHLLPVEHQILEAASVTGIEFVSAAIAAVVGQAREDIEAHCDTLARRAQFLRMLDPIEWPDGTVTARYRFRHDLYRQTLYERVPVSRRQRWHRQIGERLEVGYSPRAPAFAAELAEHFVRGGDAPRAVQYLHAAGENALQRGAYHEVTMHVHQGLTMLQRLTDPTTRAQQELLLQTTLGAALMATSGFGNPAVEQAYARAHILCQQVGDMPQFFQVLSGLWRYANGSTQHQLAWKLGTQLFTFAQQHNDPGLLLQAHHALWTTGYNCGTFAAAYKHIEQALQLYTPCQHHPQTALYGGHDPGVCCRSHAALLLWFLGYPDQAAHWSDAALALATDLAHPFTLAHTFVLAALLSQSRRDVQMTYARAETALALGHEHGFPYHIALGTMLRGWAVAAQGQAEEGIPQFCQGLAAIRATGTEHMQPQYRALLAGLYSHMGQAEIGLTTLAPAFTVVDTTGECIFEAELYRLQGELLCQQRDATVQHVETCFQHALTVARHQQAKSLELRAAMSLSRLWQRQGKRAVAYDLLASVYGWFTEGFNTADLQEARALLEELAG